MTRASSQITSGVPPFQSEVLNEVFRFHGALLEFGATSQQGDRPSMPWTIDWVSGLFGEIHQSCADWNKLVAQRRLNKDDPEQMAALLESQRQLLLKQIGLFQQSRIVIKCVFMNSIVFCDSAPSKSPGYSRSLSSSSLGALKSAEKDFIRSNIFPPSLQTEDRSQKAQRIRKMYHEAYLRFVAASDHSRLVREFLDGGVSKACSDYWLKHQAVFKQFRIGAGDYEQGAVCMDNFKISHAVVSINWRILFMVQGEGVAYEDCYQVPPGFIVHRFSDSSANTEKTASILRKYQTLCQAVLSTGARASHITQSAETRASEILDCFHRERELASLGIYHRKTKVPFDYNSQEDLDKWKVPRSREAGDYFGKSFAVVRCVMLLSHARISGIKMETLASGFYPAEDSNNDNQGVNKERPLNALDDLDLTSSNTVAPIEGKKGLLFEEDELQKLLKMLVPLGRLSQKEMTTGFSKETVATMLEKTEKGQRPCEHDPFYDLFVGKEEK